MKDWDMHTHCQSENVKGSLGRAMFSKGDIKMELDSTSWHDW